MKYLFLSILVLIASILPGQVPEQPMGSGTPENPYQISSFNNLLWIRQSSGYWGLHYIQTANIDASISTQLELGAGWTPIGNSSPFFTGTYDGQGFEIQGLYLSRESSYYTGLFGYLIGAKLNRIHLRNLDIHGQVYAGGLTGVAQNSVINNCSVTGSVSGQLDVGGMVGYANYSSVFTNCYSQVTVQGGDNVGGMVGQTGFDSTFFYRCFSSGQVNSGSASYHGGFLGRHGGGGAYYCYWDTQNSGQSTDPVAIPKTTSQMKQQATYETWNFDTQWSIMEGLTYPDLTSLAAWETPLPVTLGALAGSGLETDPYLIETAAQLNALRIAPSAWFKLTDDIDMSSTVVWNLGRGWLPVGTSADPFTGCLDGDGHSLTNLVINLPQTDNSAIFGYAQNATLRNMKLVNARIIGKNYCGSLVGDAIGGTIDLVSFSGQLFGADYVGGLTGRMVNTVMTHCQTSISYCSAGACTGGISGVLSSSGMLSGLISECNSRGEIVAGWHVGGIVGALSWGTINDCYSLTAVSGGRNLGGIAGIVGGSNPGFINRCFATGLITLAPSGSFVGGIVGYLSDGSIVSSSFWDVETTGIPNNMQNGGKSHAEMIYPGSLTTFSSWDFSSIWRHDTLSEQNSGYPYLAWGEMPVPGTVQDLAISCNEGAIHLQWTPVEGINSYRIYGTSAPYLPSSQWAYLGYSNTPSFSVTSADRMFFIVKATQE